METNPTLEKLTNSSRFLLKLLSSSNNSQILLMLNIASSTTIDILQNLPMENSDDEQQRRISNLVNDLLVLSEDLLRSDLESKNAIALLFELTSDKLRSHMPISVGVTVPQQF